METWKTKKNVDKHLEIKTTHKNLDIYREHALGLNSGHVWMTIWSWSFTAQKLFAFDEGERFLMQSKSKFLEFLRGIYRYKFGPPKKCFRGEIIQGEWRNFHRARALFLTGVKVHVLPCVLVCFLVEFDLLFAFSVLSLDCASLFIYVHEHDRLCFPMLTEETAVFDRLHLLT